MTDIERGWYVSTLVLMAISVASLLAFAFALAYARRKAAETDDWRSAFEDSEADVENFMAWQSRAKTFMVQTCPEEAEAAGLIRRAPLIIGGRDTGEGAVYPDWPANGH